MNLNNEDISSKKKQVEALENWLAQVTRRRFLLGMGWVAGAMAVRPGELLGKAARTPVPLAAPQAMPAGWPRSPVSFVQIGDFGAGNIHSGSSGPQPTINPNAQNVGEIVALYAPKNSSAYVISAGDNVYVPYYGDPPAPPQSAEGTNQPPPGDKPQFFEALNITPYDEAIGALYGSYIKFPVGSTSAFAPHGSRKQRFFTIIGDHDWWHQPRQMIDGLPVYPMDTAAYPAAVAAQPLFSQDAAGAEPSIYLQYFGNQGEGSSSGNPRYWDVVQNGIHWIGLSSDANETVVGTLSNAYYSTAVLPTNQLTPGQDNLQNSLQGQWFRSVTAQPPKSWRFVVTHYPPYTSSSPSLGGHNPAAYMQWGYEDFGVDMVFSGHVHSYERLYVNGVTYIVNGAGGTFESLAGFLTPVGGPSQVQVAGEYGALTAEKMSGKIFFSYLSVAPADGESQEAPAHKLSDRFVLLKRGILVGTQMAELRSIHVTSGGGGIRLGRGQTTYNGNLLGTGRLGKLGSGSLVLTSPSPNFTGILALSGGTLRLGDSDILASGVGLELRGGMLDASGVSQSFSTPLQVQRRSSILLDQQSALAFADSSSVAWPKSARLLIEGQPGATSLRFGQSADALSSWQLSRIRFGSPNGRKAQLNSEGYLIPA
ncbi:MAG: hypothetical protein Fur0032_17470 [Terrimicrobiaceae bacterium]